MSIPNNGKGRPKGAQNHATREIKEFLQEVYSSPEYRAALRQRLIAGTATVIEKHGWELLYGKGTAIHVEISLVMSFR